MKKRTSFTHCFSTKKSALDVSLLQGFTDIHTHYLPGVDDGFQTEEDTIRALEEMIRWGVKRVYFTPHAMADLPDNRPVFLKERFARFQSNAPAGIELRLSNSRRGCFLLEKSMC